MGIPNPTSRERLTNSKTSTTLGQVNVKFHGHPFTSVRIYQSKVQLQVSNLLELRGRNAVVPVLRAKPDLPVIGGSNECLDVEFVGGVVERQCLATNLFACEGEGWFGRGTAAVEMRRALEMEVIDEFTNLQWKSPECRRACRWSCPVHYKIFVAHKEVVSCSPSLLGLLTVVRKVHT